MCVGALVSTHVPIECHRRQGPAGGESVDPGSVDYAPSVALLEGNRYRFSGAVHEGPLVGAVVLLIVCVA